VSITKQSDDGIWQLGDVSIQERAEEATGRTFAVGGCRHVQQSDRWEANPMRGGKTGSSMLIGSVARGTRDERLSYWPLNADAGAAA
jgi:hypothetical protein